MTRSIVPTRRYQPLSGVGNAKICAGVGNRQKDEGERRKKLVPA